MSRKSVQAVLTALVVFLTLIATNRPIEIAKAATIKNDTVLLYCRFDGDPAVGAVVWATTKSLNAPTVSTTSCAEAISAFVNQGFQVAAEENEATLTYYRLARP